MVSRHCLRRVAFPLVASTFALRATGQQPQVFAAFTDQTVKQGITFVHVPHPDDGQLYMGAGGAFGDFDQDDYPDIFLAQRIGPNALYRNLGSGLGFVDIAVQAGVDDPLGEGTGGLFGDYDNDGDQDLYVLNRGPNILYRNDGPDGQGGWTFTDVTALAGVAGFARTAAAVYGDYDGDGFLDLYVANHSYELRFPQPGDPFHSDVLYHNVPGPGGERVFEDVTHHLDPARLALCIAHSAGFFDHDDDGDLDLYVVNEDMRSRDPALLGDNLLFRNDGPDGEGGWVFTEVAAAQGVDLRRKPMGIAIGDYDNDGLFDFAMSDIGANKLFKNFGTLPFNDVAPLVGVDRPITPSGRTQISWGLVFLDHDLDGFQDLYVAAGSLSPNIHGQENALFHNRGNGTFRYVNRLSGADSRWSARTVVKADYDRDGDEDLLVCNMDRAPHLYRNERWSGSFLSLRLVGTVSSRDAIGARVRVSIAGFPDQHNFVQSGSTTGGSNELRLVFAVPGGVAADTVTIDWPSGFQTVLTSVPANQFLTVTE